MIERKGQASRVVDELVRHPLTKEEIERRRGPRPKLRLRREVLDRALGPTARAREILDRQRGEAGESLTVLRDAETGDAAVVVPLERYLELTTSEIRDAGRYEATLDGGMRPPDATLTEFGVEQVNTDESWVRVGNPYG